MGRGGKKNQEQKQQAKAKLEEQLVFGFATSTPTVGEEPLLSEAGASANSDPADVEALEAGIAAYQSVASTPPDSNPSVYWKRVSRHWRDSENERYPWRFEFREGRGYVAVANRALEFADKICSERALIWTWGHPRSKFTPTQITEMQRKVSQLNDEDRETFFSLPNVYTEQEHPKEVGIFITSSFDDYECADMEGTAQSLIFSAISALKHSCMPNVLQTFLPEEMTMSLHPLRPIAEGEELTIALIDLCQVRAKRREALKKRYRFQCRCNACEYNPSFVYPPIKDATYLKNHDPSPQKKGLINSVQTFEAAMQWCDTIRQMTNDYDRALSQYLDRDDPMKGMKLITKLKEALNEPINDLWCVQYLPNVYLAKANMHQALMVPGMMPRSSRAAKTAAEKHRDEMVELTDDARQISQNISGPSSPETKRMCAMVEANWHFEAMDF